MYSFYILKHSCVVSEVSPLVGFSLLMLYIMWFHDEDGSSAKAIWISIGMVVRLAVSDGIKLKLNQGPRTEGFDTAFLV